MTALRYILDKMSDWQVIIPTIIALGGAKCILIITFLFWGIGLRGVVGSVLALVLGSMFVLAQQGADLGTVAVNQKIEERVSVRTKDFFKDLHPQLEEKFGKENTSLFYAVTSDLADGLQAVIIIIPFLLIDLLSLFIFRLLDLGMYRVEYLTLPLKVLLFLSVDGVSLVARMMVT